MPFDMHGLLDYLGACHTRLQESCLGAYPGVGAFHSCDKNQHLGAYPGVGACPGEYGSMWVMILNSNSSFMWSNPAS